MERDLSRAIKQYLIQFLNNLNKIRMNSSAKVLKNIVEKFHHEIGIYIYVTCPVGVFLNALLLGLMIKCRKKYENVNIYGFLSLSLNDFLSSLIGLPFAGNLARYIKNYELCLIINYPSYFLFMGSFLTIFVISVERFIAIIYPLHYNIILTRRRMKIIVIFVSLYSIVTNFLPVLGWNRKIGKDFQNNLPCNFIFVHTASFLKFYSIGHMIVFSCLTFILYIPVARTVYIQRKLIETKVLVGIICFISQIIFQILVWLPFFYAASYLSTVTANDRLLFFLKNTKVFKLILYLFCIYPIANPLIYGYSTRQIREEISKIAAKVRGKIDFTST